MPELHREFDESMRAGSTRRSLPVHPPAAPSPDLPDLPELGLRPESPVSSDASEEGLLAKSTTGVASSSHDDSDGSLGNLSPERLRRHQWFAGGALRS